MGKGFYVYFIIALFVVGCQPNSPGYNTQTIDSQTSNNEIADTQIVPTSEIYITIKPSSTSLPEIDIKKLSIVNNYEAKLVNQCLSVTNTPPASNSIIILRSLKNHVSGQYPAIVFMDMSEVPPRETIRKINITPNFSVTPNGELITYEASTIVNGEVTQFELITANGNFQTRSSIPWDDHWSRILGWTADQKIIISLSKAETSSPSSVSYVLVDPINGGNQAVHFRISDFMDRSLNYLPYWESWYGVVIDPTFNWAVYLKQSDGNPEMYTYALWDIPSNKPVFSLEKIFSSYWFLIQASPMPSWSRDGKQFVIAGQRQDESPEKLELFLVNVNGEIRQLTNLSSVGDIWSFYSWSPDNNYIAFPLTPNQARGSDTANIAIVDSSTLKVTDLCLSVGIHAIAPIWSPNGTQFLIVDKYDKDHQRILLVDIEKNVVFLIAEDAEPIGWMTKEP